MRKASGCRAAIVSVCAVVALAGLAEGGLIDNGTITRDTNTGLDWLDLSFTDGLNTGPILANPGSVMPGFRVATASEVVELLAGVSLAPGINSSLGAAPAANLFITFLGQTVQQSIGGKPTISAKGLTATPVSQFSNLNFEYEVRLTTEFNGSQTGTVIEWQRGRSFAAADRGVFLVKNIANGTPSTALPASSVDPITGTTSFIGAPGGGTWFAGPSAAQGGLTVAATGGALITHISFPTNAPDTDGILTVLDPTLGEVQIAPGDVHTFSVPTASAIVQGFETVARGPGSTPVFLQFDSDPADFSISAIPVPGTAILLAAAVGGLAHRRRR